MMHMKTFFYSFFIIFFFPLIILTNQAHALQISEIMYEPIFENQYANEWIEIYANKTINLENTTLCGKKIYPIINQSIENLTLNNSYLLNQGDYALILTNETEVLINQAVQSKLFFVNAKKLCTYGLSNDGDNIYLIQDGIILDNITYLDIATQGNSISRFNEENSTFFESIPTPGYPNNFTTQNNIDLSNDSQNESDECDWKTEIFSEKELFEENDKFTFKIKASKLFGSKTNITGEARLINSEGQVIRRYSLFDNYQATYSKTVTITNSEVFGDIKIATTLTTSCQDTDDENDFFETYVYVNKKEDFSTKEREARRTPLFDQNSRLEIDGSDDKADLFFYRGNTSKYAVYVTLISDGKKSKSTIHLKDKFSEYEMNLPFEKCSANNTVLLEGLGKIEERSFFKENPCVQTSADEDIVLKSQSGLKNESVQDTGLNKSNQIISTNKITGNAALDTNNSSREEFDNKKIALIILLLISTTLNALFIWKR